MRRAVVVSGIIALGLIVAPVRARACGAGGSGSYGGYALVVGIGAIAVVSADIAMSTFDSSSAAQKHHPSAGYGVLETLVAAPQFALGVYGLAHMSSVGVGGAGFLGIYTLWMGILTTHGIWTVVTAPRATSLAPDPLEPQPLQTAPPTDVIDSPPPAEPPPRFQMSLGPTYVPVGQLAQPGFGVVGRF